MSKKRQRTFSVGLAVRLWTDIEVQADSLEEAIAKAREMEIHDVIEFDTPYNDGGVEVIGAHDPIGIDRVSS